MLPPERVRIHEHRMRPGNPDDGSKGRGQRIPDHDQREHVPDQSGAPEFGPTRQIKCGIGLVTPLSNWSEVRASNVLLRSKTPSYLSVT